MRTVVLALAATVMLSGCVTHGETGTGSNTTAQMTKLSGTVAYRERIALPANATITVTLNDVSLADAPAKVISQTEFQSAGKQVPIPFELTYDRAQIDPRHRYAVSAKITGADGQLLWITPDHNELPAPGQTIALQLVGTVRP